MIKIGITGQSGFVGTHLFNFLGIQENVDRVVFDDSFFQDDLLLRSFVSKCDVVIHLAAMNRHNDPKVLYQTNILLVKKLIDAMESENVVPHVIFTSSTQRTREKNEGHKEKERPKI